MEGDERNETLYVCEPLDISALLTSSKTIFKLITAFIIILSNTMLVIVIQKSKRFRRQRFHKFIVSLAFADLLIGVTIPFMTLTARENAWHLGPFLCQVLIRETIFLCLILMQLLDHSMTMAEE